MSKKVLVASAWPYANGSLHLGHVAGLIGADVLARYHRLKGDDVLFVSGSDCHGTPIAVEADKQGISPSEISSKYHAEFKDNFLNGLSFSLDNYSQTTTDNHRQIVQDFFLKLYQSGDIYLQEEELPYCSYCQRFLPDRYIEGECYLCGFSSARGDQCDNCGNLMETKKLKKAQCKICGSTPEWRATEHFFLKLSAWQDQILKFINDSSGWRQNAKNFSREFVSRGLLDRAISRDTNWGVPIPLEGYEDKRIYVWFEAVLGYLSASKEWAKNKGEENLWKDFWQNDEARHYYVHGKDNIPFHSIILPMILMSFGNLHLPDRIISSEYLNLEGQQFSKSRGHAVWLKDFLKDFESDTLRYYLIANGPESADANFSWSDYFAKTNNELIGNFGNFVFRTLSFVKKNFPAGLDLSDDVDQPLKDFLNLSKKTFTETGEDIEQANFKKALRSIFKIIEEGNRLLNEFAPWTSIKTDKEQTARNLAVFVVVIEALAILIEPFLPQTSLKIQKSLDMKDLKWQFPESKKFLVVELEILYKKIESH